MASSSSQQPPLPAQQASQEAGTTDAQSNKPPLPLPEPRKDGDTTSLTVDGEGVKLDHLGPLVVHQDGTMSRISNWAEMSEIERQNTLRILGKRNQQRLKKLREDASSASATGSEGNQ